MWFADPIATQYYLQQDTVVTNTPFSKSAKVTVQINQINKSNVPNKPMITRLLK